MQVSIYYVNYIDLSCKRQIALGVYGKYVYKFTGFYSYKGIIFFMLL